MAFLEALVVVVVLFAAAVAATGRLGALTPSDRDPHDPGLPKNRRVEPTDLDRVRFGLVLRGYRMSEVDDTLDQLRDSLADRDREIAALRMDLDRQPPGRIDESAELRREQVEWSSDQSDSGRAQQNVDREHSQSDGEQE